jgi:hypothetical protein
LLEPDCTDDLFQTFLWDKTLIIPSISLAVFAQSRFLESMTGVPEVFLTIGSSLFSQYPCLNETNTTTKVMKVLFTESGWPIPASSVSAGGDISALSILPYRTLRFEDEQVIRALGSQASRMRCLKLLRDDYTIGRSFSSVSGAITFFWCAPGTLQFLVKADRNNS